MRILHVTHELPPRSLGGTGIYTWNIARAQAERNDVAIFARFDDRSYPEHFTWTDRRENVTVRYVNRTAIEDAPFERSYVHHEVEGRFRDFLDEVRPEVVHFQHLMYLGLGLLDLAKAARAKTVFTLHDFWLQCPLGQRLCRSDHRICDPIDFTKCGPCLHGERWTEIGKDVPTGAQPAPVGRRETFRERYDRHYAQRFAETPGRLARRPRAVLRAVERALRESSTDLCDELVDKLVDPFERRFHRFARRLRDVDLVIAPSLFVRDEFLRLFGLSPTTTLFSANGMEYGHVRRQPKERSARIRIGYVGAITPAKGLSVLLDAFLSAAAVHGNIELHVHGDAVPADAAFRDELRTKAAADPSGVRVHWHGHFDNARVGAVMAGIDLLVVPSIWYENAPLTLNEAAMTGTPVLTSDRGGMLEFVRAYDYGRTFELGNAESLAAVLREVAAEPARLRLLVGDAPRIKSAKTQAAELVRTYHALVDGTFVAPSPELQARNRSGDTLPA